MVSTFGCLGALAIGGGLAWLATRTDAPAPWLIHLAGFMPLFISLLIASLAWSLLASPEVGYLNIVLDSIGIGWNLNVYSLPGMIGIFALYYSPYAYILIGSALTVMNPEIEESAQVHGAKRFTVLRNVTFPLLTPAVIAAALLVFVLIAENFDVVQILGVPNGIETLSSRIYNLMVSYRPNQNQAAAVGVALMVVVFGVVALQNRILKRNDYATVTGKGYRPRKMPLGKWRWLALVATILYLFIAVVLPMLALVVSALRRSQYVGSVGDLFDTSVLSTARFSSTLESDDFYLGLQNSMVVSLGAAILGGLLFFAVAFVVNKTNVPGRQVLSYISAMPLAMPALVVGLGFLWTWTRSPIPLYGTLYILVLASVTRFLPQGYQGMSSGLSQIGRDLEDSAYTHGATRIRAARSITLPLVRAGVGSTLFLVFILAFRELSTTLLLFTTKTQTLSILIYHQWDNGSWQSVSCLALIFSAVLFAVGLLGRALFGLGKT
ncbi:ABC transporter permease [Micromonospora cremea]|uniref:ABC transporter permease n=1 Tax=Micromonospora cremea TaxID=709881 RepID=UPI001356489E|nr:iron ABC transporter permease [Micromonospora cremea]